MIRGVSIPSNTSPHPIPDLTGQITEGRVFRARDLNARHISPPVAVLPSLSRLMKDGIGKNYTREDHPRAASQLFASYARALEVRNLAAIIGAEEITEGDRRYLAFADAFENRFVNQDENKERSIFETLSIGWEVLSLLPAEELIRVSEDELAKHHRFQPLTGEAHAA